MLRYVNNNNNNNDHDNNKNNDNTPLTVYIRLFASNERIIVNNELERMWKEAVVA
jgi:hypothetical protein